MTVQPRPMMLKVSDVKQYLYCPRIVYYTYVAPVPRRITFKMRYGKEQHVDLDLNERCTCQSIWSSSSLSRPAFRESCTGALYS